MDLPHNYHACWMEESHLHVSIKPSIILLYADECQLHLYDACAIGLGVVHYVWLFILPLFYI